MAAGTRLLLAFLLTSSCASPASKLEGEDDTLFAGIRVEHAVGNQEKKVTGAIVLDVFVGSGEFDQFVPAGESVALDDSIFQGPLTVELDYELSFLSAAYRLRLETAERSWLEGRVGLGVNELDATLRGVGEDDSDKLLGVGPFLGAAFVFGPADFFELFLGYDFTVAVDSQERTIGQFQLGARVDLTDRVGLLVAYRDLKYEAERDTSFRSDLDLGLSGAVVMLVFTP